MALGSICCAMGACRPDRKHKSADGFLPCQFLLMPMYMSLHALLIGVFFQHRPCHVTLGVASRLCRDWRWNTTNKRTQDASSPHQFRDHHMWGSSRPQLIVDGNGSKPSMPQPRFGCQTMFRLLAYFHSRRTSSSKCGSCVEGYAAWRDVTHKSS